MYSYPERRLRHKKAYCRSCLTSLMSRQEHHTENYFEKEYGFSQAVRIGQNVWVAGMTSISPQGLLYKDSMYDQACEIFRKIELALQAVGAEMKDIVRTRLLVTKLDPESLGAIATAHRVWILDRAGVSPVCTLIGVAGLSHPDMLCEIETDAFVANK